VPTRCAFMPMAPALFVRTPNLDGYFFAETYAARRVIFETFPKNRNGEVLVTSSGRLRNEAFPPVSGYSLSISLPFDYAAGRCRSPNFAQVHDRNGACFSPPEGKLDWNNFQRSARLGSDSILVNIFPLVRGSAYFCTPSPQSI